MFLEKIAEPDWVKFICKRFKETGKLIDNSTASKIALAFECHPYNVQQLAQMSWFRTEKICTAIEIDNALDTLLMQLSMLFQTITDGLATTHVNFLKALLKTWSNSHLKKP